MLPRVVAGHPVAGARRIAGGDINEAYVVSLEGAGDVFVKTRPDAAPGEYAAEAAGLEWLAAGGARVPAVVEAADGFLALEHLPASRLEDDEDLGRMLAALHASGAPAFGHTADPLRIGAVTLPNRDGDGWATFYAEQRIRPLARSTGIRAAERVADRMDALVGPDEPPARLHGDLWTGNVHASGGRAYLIDPAAYGGHREVDLAMLQLFGSPPARTLAAYDEALPRADGHEERLGLYQLLPLLVHAALFGGSYVGAAERVARRYAG